MFKTIAKVVGVLALVLVGVLLTVPAFLSDQVNVWRSATIDAPPSQVYAVLIDLEQKGRWDPWIEKDPDIVTSFEGEGVGAVFKWESEIVGKGDSTITALDVDKSVRLRIRVLVPMDDTFDVMFSLEEADEGTTVTWSMYDELGYFERWFGLMLDGMVGADFEQGLRNLKGYVEGEAGNTLQSEQPQTHAQKAREVVTDRFKHPTLGTLHPDDTDWQVDEVRVPFFNEPIHVSLASGDASGPSEQALAGYDWIAANWPQVLKLIGEEANMFYEPYADAFDAAPRFESPDDIWGTEQLLGIRVWSKDEFTIDMRFDWQVDGDDHVVTFEIEDGRCITHSVNG